MNARLNAPTYELHPLCVLFPRMAGGEFDALREDIRANGLRTPIVLHDGMILDGGNRYRACIEAGVDPEFTEFAGGNLASFVLSANLHRRHMSAGQQAAIVASAQDWASAHKQGGTGANQHAEQTGNVAGLQTVAQRAAESGASERTQRMADKVAKADPALAVRVGHGEVSLPVAHKAVSKPAAPKSPKPAPAAKAPAAECAGMVEDEAAAVSAAVDPRDARIKDLTRERDALVVELNESLAENTRIGDVLDADDRSAAAMAGSAPLAAANKQLRAEVAGLRERVNGLMNEKNAAISHAKSWQRKAEKAEKALRQMGGKHGD